MINLQIVSTIQAIYQEWCLKNDFESKLPKVVKARKAALDKEAERQQTLHAHLKDLPQKERVIKYTEQCFREAAIRWLIATDQVSLPSLVIVHILISFYQPLGAMEHPTFKEMIELAAASTEGITVPSRKVCRQEIMNMFKNQMQDLRKKLNGDAVTSKVSLTVDAWQASNTDGYLAVTGHWVEVQGDKSWRLNSALLGFTKLNNAHNGIRLGQALYRIVERLGIAHKVTSHCLTSRSN